MQSDINPAPPPAHLHRKVTHKITLQQLQLRGWKTWWIFHFVQR